jgi:hypothetical protein
MFVLPENHNPINKKTGEPLSKGTTKIYTGILNQLATAGYTDPESLLANQKEVVALMDKEITGDTDKDRNKKRVFLSAVFFAIGSKTVAEIPHYYFAFQKAKHNYIPPGVVNTE